jgi:hypothetical protein
MRNNIRPGIAGTHTTGARAPLFTEVALPPPFYTQFENHSAHEKKKSAEEAIKIRGDDAFVKWKVAESSTNGFVNVAWRLEANCTFLGLMAETFSLGVCIRHGTLPQ